MLTNIVLRVDLADYARSDSRKHYDYDALELARQLHAQVQALPLGAQIKLIVYHYCPYPERWDFLRPDLNIEVAGSDAWILRDWYELFEDQPGAA